MSGWMWERRTIAGYRKEKARKYRPETRLIPGLRLFLTGAAVRKGINGISEEENCIFLSGMRV